MTETPEPEEILEAKENDPDPEVDNVKDEDWESTDDEVGDSDREAQN